MCIRDSADRDELVAEPDTLQRVGIDFTFGMPLKDQCDGLMVFKDVFTGYTVIQPISKRLTSEKAAKVLIQRWVSYFGIPRSFVSDNDSRFLAEMWSTVCELLKLKQSFTSLYNPKANGSVERANSYIAELLRSICHKLGTTTNWPDLIPWLQYCINAMPGPSGYSPHHLVYGRDLPIPGLLEVLTPGVSEDTRSRILKIVHDKLTQMKQDILNKKNLTARDLQVTVGDYVELRTTHLRLKKGVGKKLVPLYVGPMKVLKVVKQQDKTVACQLEIPPNWSIGDTWNVAYLRKTPADSLHSFAADLELQEVDEEPVTTDDPDSDTEVSSEPHTNELEIQFYSRANHETLFRVKFHVEQDWTANRLWTEERLRQHPYGSKALDRYYNQIKGRTRRLQAMVAYGAVLPSGKGS